MSYYDFDDHFWSPQEVCGQLPSQPQRRKFFRPWVLLAILAASFSIVAIAIPSSQPGQVQLSNDAPTGTSQGTFTIH